MTTTIHLTLDYHTVPGQHLCVHVLHRPTSHTPSPDVTVYPLSSADNAIWRGTLFFPSSLPAVDYYYSVLRNGQQERTERRRNAHHLPLPQEGTYRVADRWHDDDDDSLLPTFAPIVVDEKGNDTPLWRQIIVRAPRLGKRHTLSIVGATEGLGAWHVAHALPLRRHRYGLWSIALPLSAVEGTEEVEYKFVAKDDKGGVYWEEGSNRRSIVSIPSSQSEIAVVEEVPPQFALPRRRYAGTVIPVFALRSEDSWGVGDFRDLQTMVDICARSNQHILQILPINDTTRTHTWEDSYPYCAISVFALHPQYMALSWLPPLADDDQRKGFEKQRQALNALPTVDYERVNALKNEYLALLFAQEGQRLLATEECKEYVEENKSWLVPYAQYAVRHSPQTTVPYHYFVQYLLYSQMVRVHKYAHDRGVLLKGDIPIGVSREGCDVEQAPQYFNLSGQAGAPPDAFATTGQNWGFPTYNWQALLADDCRWWQQRLAYMAHFFDAYRIDHVLGFFRIWEIPISAVQGLLGHFVPAQGMTAEEIARYGLPFREEEFTTPFLPADSIDREGGEEEEAIRERYLVATGKGHYMLREEYNTQRKIVDALPGDDNKGLRDRLLALAADVLFVRDHTTATLFHPRIAGQYTLRYAALSDEEKSAYNRLYDDYFYHRNEQLWYDEAMKKLPYLVDSTEMVPCAEDLGMVPACVHSVLEALKILSLEIQTMPKAPYVTFGETSTYHYRAVCTISTHDMPTMRQWWEENADRAQQYYNDVLHHDGIAPQPLPAEIAEEIVQQHLDSPAMLCILALQDWLAIDEHLRHPRANEERINIPAIAHHYWRYRMHRPLAALLTPTYLAHVAALIAHSRR